MKSYYVSPKAPTSAQGDGSRDNPICAGGGMIEASLKDLPENADIRLMPGFYATRGRVEGQSGWKPKTGQRIRGLGIDPRGTTILLDAKSQPEGQMVGCILGDSSDRSDGLRIENLTFDLTLRENGRRAVCAVGIYGSGCLINDCIAINWGNACEAGHGAESFIFAIGSGPNPAMVPNRIINTVCTEFSGIAKSGNVTCFINGGTFRGGLGHVTYSPEINNCHVAAQESSDNHFIVGFTESLCTGGLIARCGTVNVRIGVYQDSWQTDSLMIAKNSFLNCAGGIYLRFEPKQAQDGYALGRLVCVDNLVELNPELHSPTGISLYSSQVKQLLIDRASICGNTIGWKGSRTVAGMGMKLLNVNRLLVADNVVSVPGAVWGQAQAQNCGTVYQAMNNFKVQVRR